MTLYGKIIAGGLRILPAIPLLLLVPTAAVSADVHPSGPMLAQAQQKDSVVTQVQKELQKRGYYDGSIDGKTSPQTRAAAMRFQADAGLSVSGTVNEELLKALRTADKDVRRN